MHSTAEWMANQQQIPFVWRTGQLALTDATHHHRAHPAPAIAIQQPHYACWTHMATMPGTIHAYCHNPGAEECRCPAQWDRKWHSKCRCNGTIPFGLGSTFKVSCRSPATHPPCSALLRGTPSPELRVPSSKSDGAHSHRPALYVPHGCLEAQSI